VFLTQPSKVTLPVPPFAAPSEERISLGRSTYAAVADAPPGSTSRVPLNVAPAPLTVASASPAKSSTTVPSPAAPVGLLKL